MASIIYSTKGTPYAPVTPWAPPLPPPRSDFTKEMLKENPLALWLGQEASAPLVDITDELEPSSNLSTCTFEVEDSPLTWFNENKSFTASGEYLGINAGMGVAALQYQNTTGISWEWFLKVNSMNGRSSIGLFKYGNSSSTYRGFQLSAQTNGWIIYNISYNNLWEETSWNNGGPPLNTWMHMVLTVYYGQIHLYVDGVDHFYSAPGMNVTSDSSEMIRSTSTIWYGNTTQSHLAVHPKRLLQADVNRHIAAIS